MEIEHPVLGPFSIIGIIGNGSFATVYYAKHTQLHYPVAIKIFHDNISEDDIIKSLTITKTITHPFIRKDFDHFKTKKGENCILMEYVKGNTLLEFANSNSPLSETEIHSIFGQLIIAIDFLHKKQIIHRDLKCENILIDNHKNIRLIDLNFSCHNSILHSTFCGSPGYVAPEIINKQWYGVSIDIWSLGIILYAITYRKLPFENSNISMLFKSIISEEPPYPNDSRISEKLVDLIKKMLIKNPNERISIEDIKKHPFFKSDSNDKNFIFNQQKINYFIRDPLAKVTPEMQIIKQMKLSMEESFKAIAEIKSGKITYYSMTYNILFKSFISNVQIKNFANNFINPSNLKLSSSLNRNQDITNNKKIVFNEPQKEKVRTLSRSNSDDLMSSKDNFNIETENNNQIELKLFLNNNVNFRFNSIAKPLVGIGIRKRSTANLKNIKLVHNFPQIKNVNTNASSSNALPLLKSSLKK